MIEKYDEEDIATAVTNCVDSWDMDTLVMYATEMLYKEYMDRSRPIEHIDELMEEFGAMKSDRNKQDHITDKPFKTIICDICGKEFSIMSIDSKYTICPKCDMPEGKDK